MANLVFDFLHNYKTGERRESDPADAYQYDEGHVFEAVVPVAVTSCEIHYWARGFDEAEAYTPASITQNADNSYTITGNIPNKFFETYGDLRVYIVVTDGDASITTYEGRIHICERSKPDDYVDDDPDNEATRVLVEARAAAATATAAAETAQDVADSIPADYTQLSDDVSALKEDLNSLEDIALTFKSSTLETSNAASYGKRFMLNVEKPIPSDVMLGALYLPVNVPTVSASVKVELAKRNANGTYTVYDSVSKSVSMSGLTQGDIVPVMDIGKVTQDDTYVFYSYDAGAQFRMKATTGKYMVVCDSTDETTFTTRDSSGYEIIYLLYCGVTSKYIANNIEKIKSLRDGVGDYAYYEFFNASQSSGGFWNEYIDKSLPLGTKVRFELTKYNSQSTSNISVRAYDSEDNFQTIGNLKLVGGIAEKVLTLNAVKFRIFTQLNAAVTNAEIGCIFSTDVKPGITGELFDSCVSHVYHVEKDGSGDFTNLATAIDVATQWMDSIVYVGAGTWNILDELGSAYLATASDTNQGIVLKNRVHVICSSKAYIKCLFSVADPDNITAAEAAIIDHISAFNSGQYGFTLENADIEVANVRYCVHDERNAETDQYNNYYLNCRMKNTNQTSGSRAQCIGGGLGYDGHIVIDGCTFENPLRENYGVVSYHNAHGSATDSRSLIEVKGCYFKGTNTFRAGYYGNSTVMTQCLVHGNSMGTEPYVTQEDASFTNVNMEIVAWNNEIRSA